MKTFSLSPLEIPRSFWRNRHLIGALIKREVLGRYRGSILGVGWSFLRPLFMLIIYTFVFGSILQTRWGQNETNHNWAQFSLVLFSGLLVFDLFSDVLNRSVTVVVDNPNYVKKIIFPLEILPLVTLGSAIIHAAASLCIFFAAEALLMNRIPWTVCLFPLVVLPLLLISLGLSWVLASLGVYLRDVSQVTGTITAALMFTSAVFYPASAIPESFRFLIAINPLAWLIESSRDVLVFGAIPNLPFLACLTLFSFFVAWIGFIWFQTIRKGFADVI